MTAAESLPRHVVFATGGTLGDLYPFIGLALAMQRRGHRVSLICPVVHVPLVERVGLPCVGCGTVEGYEAVLADPDLWHPRRGFSVVWRSLDGLFDQLADAMVAASGGGHTVLVVHPAALPVADVARARRPGLRVVAAYLAPSNLRTCHDPLTIGPLHVPRWVPMAWRRGLWRWVGRRVIDPVAVPGLNARRRAAGLPPIAHFADHVYGVADASLALFPAWFAPPPPDWPRELVTSGFVFFDPAEHDAFSPELSRFLAGGDAPLVVTTGSGHRHGLAAFDTAVAALQRLGRRAVLLSAHADQVPAALPASVLWQRYVPLGRLLPQAAALVHHGGIGTTPQALRAGVPQLVMPMAHDQFDNAARVRHLGAGTELRAAAANPRRLTHALGTLLASQATREAARHVAQRFVGTDPCDAACRLLESVATPLP